MVKKNILALAVSVLSILGLVPWMALADEPTGKEPWSAAFLEANPEGISGYVLKNLINTEWQDGLNIWWRANIPCGTFTGSGLSATWDRGTKDCVEIGSAAKFGTIAIFIENTKFSGKERIYEDADGPRKVELKDGFEHLIVYAEYPEEGREHGFGTALMYADKLVLEKYASAKEGTTNTSPFPGVKSGVSAGGQVPEATPVSSQPEQMPSDSNVPWVLIAVGIIALGGAAYYFRNSLNLNKLSILTQTEKKTGESSLTPEKTEKEREEDAILAEKKEGEESERKSEKEDYDMRTCEVEFNIAEEAETAVSNCRHALEKMRYKFKIQGMLELVERELTSAEFEKQGGERQLEKLQAAFDAARIAAHEARLAYEVCTKKAIADRNGRENVKSHLGDKAPADYAKPEGVPDEPEVM